MLTSPSGELLPSDLLVLVLAQLSSSATSSVKSVCKAFAAARRREGHRVCFEHARVLAWRRRRRSHHHRRGTTPSRCGADGVRAHHPGAHDLLQAVALLPAERASSPARATTTRSCVARRCPRRTFEVGGACSASRRCPTACTCGRPGGDVAGKLRRGPAVPRRRDARPHLQGHTATCDRGGDADGQHIISGSYDNLVEVWSVASKSLGVRRAPTPSRGGGDARRQAHPQRRDDKTVRVWLLNGTLENTFKLHRDGVPRGAARQPARALRLVRPHRQALQRQRRRRPAHLHAPHRPWSPGLLPDGRRFVSGSRTAPPASSRSGSGEGLISQIYRTASLALTPPRTIGSGRAEPKERGGLAVGAHASPSATPPRPPRRRRPPAPSGGRGAELAEIPLVLLGGQRR